MDSKEIQEARIAVGLFMDMKPVYSAGEVSGWEGPDGRMMILGQYTPDSDWNELMPAVKKCFYLNEQSGFLLFDASNFYEADITLVWASVIKFVRWYNQSNP